MKTEGPFSLIGDAKIFLDEQLASLKYDFSNIEALVSDIFPKHVLNHLPHDELLSFRTVSKAGQKMVHHTYPFRDQEKRQWLKSLQGPIVFSSYYASFVVDQNNQIHVFTSDNYYLSFSKTIDFFMDKPPVVQIEGGGAHVLFLSEDGQVYAFGDNGYGQLGLGYDFAENTTKIDFFDDKPLKQIATGEDFSLFLTQDGQVFSCGANAYGQLGLGHNNTVHAPTKLDIFNNTVISQIAAGREHAVFVSDDGKVFSCGNNKDGRLGLGHFTAMDTPTPIEFFDDKPIKHIAAGYDFTYLLSDELELFSCGNNNRGQLGLENPIFFLCNFKLPTQVHFFDDKPLKNIVASKFMQGFFIADDGSMYCCGHNGNGELGLGNDSDYSVTTPQKLSPLENNDFIQVASGDHTIYLGVDGHVYLSGPKTLTSWSNFPKYAFSLCEPNITKISLLREKEEQEEKPRFSRLASFSPFCI